MPTYYNRIKHISHIENINIGKLFLNAYEQYPVRVTQKRVDGKKGSLTNYSHSPITMFDKRSIISSVIGLNDKYSVENKFTFCEFSIVFSFFFEFVMMLIFFRCLQAQNCIEYIYFGENLFLIFFHQRIMYWKVTNKKEHWTDYWQEILWTVRNNKSELFKKKRCR